MYEGFVKVFEAVIDAIYAAPRQQ